MIILARAGNSIRATRETKTREAEGLSKREASLGIWQFGASDNTSAGRACDRRFAALHTRHTRRSSAAAAARRLLRPHPRLVFVGSPPFSSCRPKFLMRTAHHAIQSGASIAFR